MSEEHPHLGAFALLPAPKGLCQQCAVKHDPSEPHDQQSLAYQYWFYGKNGRWPTWKDAMAHCSSETQELWTTELEKMGVTV